MTSPITDSPKAEASDSLIPDVPYKSEAEARIEAALKVAREIANYGTSVFLAEDLQKTPPEVREALYARGAAIRNIIRILEDGK